MNELREPKVIERFSDNGEHSHWELINPETGDVLWSENSKTVVQKWDGYAGLANQIFGNNYGVDWEYESKESQNIMVNGRLIKVGDPI